MAILRYVSDLHLERFKSNVDDISIIKSIYKFDRDKNCKYYLALVGDICNPIGEARKKLIRFFELIHEHYHEIFYILGNHEYYSKDKYNMTYIREKLDKAVRGFPKIKILDNDVVDIGDIRILGTTLWSHVSDNNKFAIEKYINDYKMIYVNDKNITTDVTNELNKTAREWLEKEINNSNKICVVLTHHAPLFSDLESKKLTCDKSYVGGVTNEAFHNDMNYLIRKPIVAWIYGHTHYVSTFKQNDVLIATNQIGYHGEFTGYKGVQEINLYQNFIDNI